jgi:maltose O-acetyltransferase
VSSPADGHLDSTGLDSTRLDTASLDTAMRERMLAGRIYRADDPLLVAETTRAQRLAHRINTFDPTDTGGLRALFAELLGDLGADTVIRPPFHCDYGYPTRIGSRTFINFGMVILDCAPVRIGDDVQIGPGVRLLPATHPLDPVERARGDEYAQPITIDDGAWLGGGVTVLPGVRIGAGSIVGAASVVTRDVPPGVVAAGNPCRVLRPIPPGRE